jgi:hypothetical protein
MRHPKHVGDATTLAVMAAVHAAGCDMYVPFGENTRCDLVVDDGTRLVRLQCKTGRLRGGSVLFSPCSCYGHHRNPAAPRRSYHGQIDAFGVYCADTGGVYLVPIADVPNRNSVALRVEEPRNHQRQRVRWASTYEIARVVTRALRATAGAG